MPASRQPVPDHPGLNEESIFCAALESPSAAAQAAYLDEACRGDPELRRRIEHLLRIRTNHESFLAQPAVCDVPAMTEEPGSPLDASGAEVGPYKLLERIGEGGFGEVYMAEQTEPVRRRVALKIIKPGMDTRQVIARFEAEREALAMMDHPNIARVLDAGATGMQSTLGPARPYVVMELVKGAPITRFCDEQRLDLRDRLALFIDACHAVQHAHQKGVIHRDIKPSNVLVSRYDDKPVVKIIDFGIAKALGGRLTDRTLFTEFRQMIGTPAYMSPEQAGLSDLDVDTRSDVYSLGVLLYELLSGTTPFEPQRLRSAEFDELRRIIREEEPPPPSTRLSGLFSLPASGASRQGVLDAGSSAAAEIAAARQSDPRSLVRSLCGEPDWIVMKCLEKDRSRRYQTANDLALDISRFLSAEPVVAAPPSTTYRLRKFIRRHRLGVAASAAIGATLVLGIAGTTAGMAWALHERSRERQQRELAETREKETRQVSDFQAAMLSGVNVQAMGSGIKKHFLEQLRAALSRQYVGESPNRRARTPDEIDAAMATFEQGADAAQTVDVARQVMDEFLLARAAEELKKFADQPLVQADLHSAIGATYKGLGLYSAAEPHLTKALELYRRVLGDDHTWTLQSISNVGSLLHAQGRRDEAEPYFGEVLAGRKRVLGDEHPDTLNSISGMGYLRHAQGRFAEAEPYYRDALAGRRRVLGGEHPDTLTSIDNMGALLQSQGRLAEAEPYIREALAGCRRVLGDEHPDTLTSINNLGCLLKDQGLKDPGKLAEAEPYLLEALVGRRRVLGDYHPLTLMSINNMGDLLHNQGKLAEAEPYYRDALEKSRRILGDEHPDTLVSINNMGYLLRDQRKLEEAQSLFAEGTRAARAGLGDHPSTATLEHHYADVLREIGRLDEALDLARAAVDRYRAHPEWSPHEAGHARRVLVAALRAAGQEAEALAAQWESVQAERQRPGAVPADVASALAGFAFEAIAARNPAFLEQAEQAVRECLQIRETLFPDDHPQAWMRYNALSMLGEVLVVQGAQPSLTLGARVEKLREAGPLLLKAWEKLKADPNVPPPSATGGVSRRRSALERIAKLYDAWHIAAPEAGHEIEADRWRSQLKDFQER